MARDGKTTAPYAPIKNVLDTIHRLRDRGVPNPLTPESVQSIGVPEGNAHRTVFAMRFLGLIDEAGAPTPTANRMKEASTAEYPVVLGEIVRDAYQMVFELVDPAKDSEIEIADAFRRFDPAGQRFRMVPLFLGLCAEAGIIPPEKAAQVKVARPMAAGRTPKANAKSGPMRGAGSGPDTAQQNAPHTDVRVRDAPPPGELFSVSEDDIGALAEDEFTDVWNALGVLARARARVRREALERQRAEEEQRLRASQAMWSGMLGTPRAESTEADDIGSE